jgi:hypothetical protein
VADNRAVLLRRIRRERDALLRKTRDLHEREDHALTTLVPIQRPPRKLLAWLASRGMEVGGDGGTGVDPWRTARNMARAQGCAGYPAARPRFDATWPESTVQRQPSLTLRSDGGVRAPDASGEFFGFGRTRAISRESAGSIAQAGQAFGPEEDSIVLTLTFVPAEAAHG